MVVVYLRTIINQKKKERDGGISKANETVSLISNFKNALGSTNRSAV